MRTTHPLHYLIKAADAGRATFFINQLDPHQMRRFKFSKSASLIKNLPWPADKRAAPAIYSSPLFPPAHNPREYLITGLRPLSPIMWRGRKQTHLRLSSSRPAAWHCKTNSEQKTDRDIFLSRSFQLNAGLFIHCAGECTHPARCLALWLERAAARARNFNELSCRHTQKSL